MSLKLKLNSQISVDRYEVIARRYELFQKALDDTTKDPVRVFDELTAKHLGELKVIRACSRDLQIKKEEDIARAEQTASEVIEEVKPESATVTTTN